MISSSRSHLRNSDGYLLRLFVVWSASVALVLVSGPNACLVAVEYVVTIDTTDKHANPISPYLFGVNHFMYSANTMNAAMEKRLKEAGVTLVEVPGGNPRGRYYWHNNTLARGLKLPPERSATAGIQMARRIAAVCMVGVNDRLGILHNTPPDIAQRKEVFPARYLDSLDDGVNYAEDWLRYLNNHGLSGFKFSAHNPEHAESFDVHFWELSSEPFLWMGKEVEESKGWSSERRLREYCRWFRVCATRLKKVDPNVRIMGPGLTATYYFTKMRSKNPRPIDTVIPTFLRECGDLIDVLTVHRYPGAHADMTPVMHYTQVWDKIVPALQRWTREYCVDQWKRKPGAVRIGVSEWSFANKSDRRADLSEQWPTGIWLADCLCRFMSNDIFLASYWCVSNDFHGLFSSKDLQAEKPRPFYHMFGFIRQHALPDVTKDYFMVRHASDVPGVCVYPILGEDALTILVVNKSAASATLALRIDGELLRAEQQRYTLLRDGEAACVRSSDSRITVEEMSLNAIRCPMRQQ